MQYRYPQPKNEDAFEEFCLILLREHWSLPTLDRYGHRGERQDGVDLIDTGGGTPLRGVQCKHHEASKTLPPRELEIEVEKAKGFPQKLDEFSILTTAKKSTHAQRKGREINREHAAKGLFTLRLLTWDDIERIVNECPTGQEFLGVQSPRVLRQLLRAEIHPIHQAVRSQGDEIHGAELDEVKKHVEAGQVQLALLLLAKLRNKAWDPMSPRHRYRWCTLFADAEFRLGNELRAAQLLIEAKAHQPDDDDAASNEVVAYELLGNRAKAHELAVAGVAARPHSASLYACALRTATSREVFVKFFDNRPEHLKDHPELWVAAATRDDMASSESAEETARRAVSLAPDDARSWFALAEVLLRSEFRRVDPEGAPTGDAPVLETADPGSAVRKSDQQKRDLRARTYRDLRGDGASLLCRHLSGIRRRDRRSKRSGRGRS